MKYVQLIKNNKSSANLQLIIKFKSYNRTLCYHSAELTLLENSKGLFTYTYTNGRVARNECTV